MLGFFNFILEFDINIVEFKYYFRYEEFIKIYIEYILEY